MILQQTYQNKKVLVTGHTGFKGTWLIQILHQLGAIVKGISLAPEQHDDLYNVLNGDNFCYTSIIGDIRDRKFIYSEIIRFQPDYIFHLAAQALVRPSYEYPIETFDTNVMGTIHVMDAVRDLQKKCNVILITTDKVYENLELGLAFKEEDKLGGYDPYSASKAACEIAISSYRNSYFNPKDYALHQKSIASVRAGNVIGGGDMSVDRIIPDIVRAIQRNKAVAIRNPNAIRPWQHVLEPLAVYLLLGQEMNIDPVKYATAFNIGPESEDALSVIQVVEQFILSFGNGSYEVITNDKAVHEAGLLLLDNSKLKSYLQWKPKWSAAQAIQYTAEWYANTQIDAAEKCKQQITHYFSL